MTPSQPTADRIGAIRPVAPAGAPEFHHDLNSDGRSIGTLLRDLRDQTTDLLRQELALARTEMREKVGVVGRNVAYLATGGLIACLGLVFVLAAITVLIGTALANAGVAESTAGWLAPLIVGVAVGVAGYVLVHKGLATLRDTRLYPDQTVETMKENARWIGNKTT